LKRKERCYEKKVYQYQYDLVVVLALT
jgi:hypothetical protein